MADNRPIILKTRAGEAKEPDLERLYGNRWRLTRYLDRGQLGAVPTEIFEAYGTADIANVPEGHALEDLCFVGTGFADAPERTKKWATLVFETLTDTLVDEVAPVVDYDLNGLRRTTMRLIAKPGIDLDSYGFDVGEALNPLDGVGVLAQLKDESTDFATKVTAVYIEPGIVSKSKSGGPASLPGTVRHTWLVWAMTAAESGIPGVVTDDDEENVEGYPVRRFSSLTKGTSGSVTDGNIGSYEDNIEITRPGTIEIGVDGASAGAQTPYLVQTSPTSGIVKATVTVAIATAATAAAPVAFNLDTIQVAVRAKTRTVRYIGSEVGESVTEHVYAEQIGIDHTVLRGYVISSATGSGTEYRYSYNSALNDDGDPIIGEAFQSHIYRTITLTGSGSAPPTTGVWRREVEPVFTAANGTAYFRVTTWTI